MSIPDRLIGQYFRCFADVHQRELEELDTFIGENPMEAKKQLATLIVATETGNIEDSLRERESFERKFFKKIIRNEDCIALTEDANTTIFEALMKSGQFKSKSELRRLFDQKAVRSIDDDVEHILIPEIIVDQVHGVVRIGKRLFFRFVTAQGMKQ
jgi:tyrosyl-tRNA synthetase